MSPVILRVFLFWTILPVAFGQTPVPTFQIRRINPGCIPLTVVVGDFNGDPKPDLACACNANSSSPIMVLLGNGDGTFQRAVPVSGAGLGTIGGNKLIAADLNLDGETDLAYISSNGNLMTLLSAGDGTFRTIGAPPPNTKPALVASADLNGDNIPDLIFFTGNNDSLVSYAFGKSDGAFAAPIVVPSDLLTSRKSR